ncbi:MAG: hypothetical protein NC331_11405 [Lachnospiraceae bacterium]|nr:hypothetical protein [Lachnospiraceae bacterium]MCM1239974.1 hypothetical protein [Lachnospiraceae bacterium]
MERLTRRSEDSGVVWFVDHEHGGACREPCEMDAHHARLAIEKLAEYEDLEEQGKLIGLPCAVGDTVYSLVFGEIVPLTVERFVAYRDHTDVTLGSGMEEHRFLRIGFDVKDLGKEWFLARGEAEAALDGGMGR